MKAKTKTNIKDRFVIIMAGARRAFDRPSDF